jgi:hypothetical protein
VVDVLEQSANEIEAMVGVRVVARAALVAAVKEEVVKHREGVRGLMPAMIGVKTGENIGGDDLIDAGLFPIVVCLR